MPHASALAPPRPRLHQGVLEFPVHHMRGGTSTGLILWQRNAPADSVLREELLRHLMGVPGAGRNDGNRQITGLGRGTPTSNKVFFADVETHAGSERIVSTLAQLAHNHGDIDWSVNCGNMSSALQLWAIDTGLLPVPAQAHADVSIHNTNTGTDLVSRMQPAGAGGWVGAAIPGVDGAWPAVDLFLQSPVGAKTGRLLPTGAVIDIIDGHQVSCVDVAVPMVICAAHAFGKTGRETVQELDADPVFKAALRRVWVEAGLRMGLKRRDGTPMTADALARSETIPKICIVAPPAGAGHIAVRYFTPQTGHASMAVSGGCCLGAAALIPGTVAHQIAQRLPQPGAQYSDILVAIENPAGMLEATIVCRRSGDTLDIASAAYRRNTQILVRGYVPLYRASPALVRAMTPS